MVLVDFTLAERWRVFGELSMRPVRSTGRSVGAEVAPVVPLPTATVTRSLPITRFVTPVVPHESAARRQSEAVLMQRLL